jgi:hypothetical protein
VLATLSRWRSWVQVPSGALDRIGTVRKPAKRPSSRLGDLWVRLPLVPVAASPQQSRSEWKVERRTSQPCLLLRSTFDSPSCGWCSSRRPVNPLPSNCEAAGERFDSFTTHWPFGSVVYWLGRHPLKVEKGVRLPSGLLSPDSWRRSDICLTCSTVSPLLSVCSRTSKPPGVAGVRSALIRPTSRFDTGAWDMRAGWCSAEFHTLGCRGSNPGPAINVEATLRRNQWHGTRTGIAVRSRV